MHPSGIKFGLAHGLLQFRGADTVVSDSLFAALTSNARKRIRGHNRVSAQHLFQEVINDSVGDIVPQFGPVKHSESTPFFLHLPNLVGITLMPMAESAGLGRRIGKDFLPDPLFQNDFYEKEKRLEIPSEVTQADRLLFQAYCSTVKTYCARNAEAMEHSDLLSVYLYDLWARAGCVELTILLRHPSPWRKTRNTHPLAYVKAQETDSPIKRQP